MKKERSKSERSPAMSTGTSWPFPKTLIKNHGPIVLSSTDLCLSKTRIPTSEVMKIEEGLW